MSTVRALFARHGLRCTRQREVVYGALQKTRRHPTPEQLHAMCRDIDPSVSLATVYNTLDTLVDAGLAKRFASETGSNAYRYDADVDEHAHLETSDGRLLDLPEALSEELMDAIPEDLVRRIAFVMGVHVDRVAIRLISSDDQSRSETASSPQLSTRHVDRLER